MKLLGARKSRGLAPLSSTARPFREVPRAPTLQLMRGMLNGEARDDMLGTFSSLREELGPVVAHGVGPLRTTFLFGPDANRFVLIDPGE